MNSITCNHYNHEFEINTDNEIIKKKVMAYLNTYNIVFKNEAAITFTEESLLNIKIPFYKRFTTIQRIIGDLHKLIINS